MEKSKKIISLLLALIMTLSVFTIVPFSAGAAQADVSPAGAPESYTDIHVGDTLFPEFEDGVDTAYFKFIPEQDMPIIFTSRSSFGVTAYLYDAEMNQLAFSEESSYDLDRAGGFNFKIAYDVTAGNTYYFGVKYKYESSSFFDVQLRELPEIRVGETAAAMFAKGGDYAYFKFVPEQDMTIDFTALTNAEAYGYLYDADMNLLTYHENRRGSFDIVYDVTAGNTYYLCAYYSYGGSINVQLTIKKDPEIKPTEPPTQVINSGTTGDCTWTLDNGVLTISGNGKMEDYDSFWENDGPVTTAPWGGYSFNTVVIESGVTSIGDYAFYCCSGLTSVTIPDSVKSIGKYAFAYCEELTSVTIPDSVTSIGESAFSGCSGLTGVMIGNSVTSIGYGAFEGCTGLTSVMIGNSVTSIGDSAFSGCTGLTSITIPDSVTSIGEDAFYGCTGLTSVTIPDSVTKIGYDAFEYCTAMTSITIGNGLKSIGGWAFDGCTGLTRVNISDLAAWCDIYFDTYNSNPLCYAHNLYLNDELVTDLVIPDGVPTIGINAFFGCTGLKSLTIPASVWSIWEGSFSSCTGLTSITVDPDNETYDSRNNCNAIIYTSKNELLLGCKSTVIPDSVTSIRNSAFAGCAGLESITIPDSVTSIGNYAFSGCAGLESVTIPGSVTSIGDMAFRNCTGLTSVIIGNGVKSIDDAFAGCTGLTSITIPDSVTSIGAEPLEGTHAFDDCTSLTRVNISDLAAWCNIEFDIYDSNPLSFAHNLYLNDELVTDLVIPDSVTKISDYAFSGCDCLTSVTIPDSVTSIGDYAFYECNGLTIVTIPDSVTSIGDKAFRNCTGLTSVTIPGSVTSIGEYAFGYYFFDWEYLKVDDFTICGVKGSEAERYANDNGFMFVALGTPVELHDDTTDISVTLTDDVELSVADVTGSETTGNIQLVGEKIEKAYEIKLMNDGEAIQPSGEVTVKIPCDNENAKVYRVEADDSLTDMHAVYTDGYLVFTTDHFSVYIVAVDEPEANTLLGDADCDDTISILDATAIQRVLADFAVKPFNEKAACVTGEDLSILDATMIQRYLADFATPYHIGDYVK